MEYSKAIEILRRHNAWRRGAEIPMEEPRVIGEAIDAVVENSCKEKPAEWSEREDRMLASAISHICDSECFDHFHDITKEDIISWLKSLRPQPKVEWSEEDEDNLHRVIRVLEDNDSDWDELSNWLKSLKNRGSSPKSNTNPPHWKPSEEQPEVDLEKAAEDSWVGYEYRESPRGLYSTCYVDGFKAGAEWMAGQGKSIVARIGLATNEICCTIPEEILDSLGVRADDEIIIQIRKK